MSHKVSKQIRKTIRAGGNDPRQVKLARKQFLMATTLLGAGPGCWFCPRDLTKDCGRALYRGMKKLYRTSAFA